MELREIAPEGGVRLTRLELREGDRLLIEFWHDPQEPRGDVMRRAEALCGWAGGLDPMVFPHPWGEEPLRVAAVGGEAPHKEEG